MRKLADIKKELKQNLDAIYAIDKDIADNLSKYTLAQIKAKKKNYPGYHKKVKELNELINTGQYLEYQEEGGLI